MAPDPPKVDREGECATVMGNECLQVVVTSQAAGGVALEIWVLEFGETSKYAHAVAVECNGGVVGDGGKLEIGAVVVEEVKYRSETAAFRAE